MENTEVPVAEATILAALRNIKMKKSDIARLYAQAIMDWNSGSTVNWVRINSSIRGRWSMAALGDIKKEAHKIVKDNVSR